LIKKYPLIKSRGNIFYNNNFSPLRLIPIAPIAGIVSSMINPIVITPNSTPITALTNTPKIRHKKTYRYPISVGVISI